MSWVFQECVGVSVLTQVVCWGGALLDLLLKKNVKLFEDKIAGGSLVCC